METIISKSGSLKGYKFYTWLSRNKNTIKTLISAGVGIAIFFIPQITDPTLSASAGVVGATFTKLVADTFDFWISDVKIEVDPTTGNITK